MIQNILQLPISFPFAFNINKSLDILNFAFSLLDGKWDLIKFEATERKVPVLSFKIQIIKWVV